MSDFSVGVRGPPVVLCPCVFCGEVLWEWSIRVAVLAMGSSSSESGRGVGLMSSRPVLGGREGRCGGQGGMGDSWEEEEEMGLPSIRTSPSESPRSLRNGSFVRFSFSSIAIRESRLFRSASGAGEGHGSGVPVGGVQAAGGVEGIGGGSGIGGVSGRSLTGRNSGVVGKGAGGLM